MAINRKTKRRLRIGDSEYFYSVTGQDGWISLIVMTEVQGASKLSAYFHYHQEENKEKTPSGNVITHLTNQFVVTPYTVRQTIDLALSKGWNPFEKGKTMELRHIDDLIDLRLEQNRAEAIKTKLQPFD